MSFQKDKHTDRLTVVQTDGRTLNLQLMLSEEISPVVSAHGKEIQVEANPGVNVITLFFFIAEDKAK